MVVPLHSACLHHPGWAAAGQPISSKTIRKPTGIRCAGLPGAGSTHHGLSDEVFEVLEAEGHIHVLGSARAICDALPRQ